ncbi:hypothetical protein NM208_g11919 [Fusarium decemcellulare]|uniref:Uncharacterized protein n=1 Tax=Fusarium decemcellulare TaxID=57161 RepID=A0ACC1RQP2_9HYPO|nr:hypothetical protein NM208_g11919 [Fusarium decemcellulare]
MAPRRRRNQTSSSSAGQGLPLHNVPAPAPMAFKTIHEAKINKVSGNTRDDTKISRGDSADIASSCALVETMGAKYAPQNTLVGWVLWSFPKL